jgi:uncharacterized membrane protein YccC
VNAAAGSGTLRQILAPTLRVEWSQFEGRAALRCTIGVAIPLLVGAAFAQPSISAFGAVGAVSVGFGSFQGTYRSRAAVMVYAAVAMAVSIFVGSLAGLSNSAAIATAAFAAFASGLMVALGPAASFVGLQSVVAILIAGGFPDSTVGAAGRALIVFGGGLLQTLLVVMVWPLRRFSAERRTIAAAYHTLSRYAAQLPASDDVAPEPHTFATIQSPLADPQPFAHISDVLVFQALLDEAERIRASLASLATEQHILSDDDRTIAVSVAASCGRALDEIATAVAEGREPREDGSFWDRLHESARRLPRAAIVDALLGQIRAAWRTAGVLTAPANRRIDALPEAPLVRPRIRPLLRRPPVRDSAMTLRANLTMQSAACRHALRLAVTVTVATSIYRLLALPRGYWLPMTALLVLKPEFHDTFARGVGRIVGTLAGAALATIIVEEFAPGPAALSVMVLIFVWGCYALFRMNYTIFAICITGYVVFILMLSGVGEMTAASARSLYTIGGGVLALVAYAVWPTWAASTVRDALATLLAAHASYVSALLDGYINPAQADLEALSKLRSTARLARSNAEALTERMLAEPARRAAIGQRTAVGLLAALRRHSLAALALHAGVERGVAAPIPALAPLAGQMREGLARIAAALRDGTSPLPMPPLRATERAMAPDTLTVIQEETDIMVDSINTMAELLAADRAPES